MPMSVPKQQTTRNARLKLPVNHQIDVQYALQSKRGIPSATSIRQWSESTLSLCKTNNAELTIRFVCETEMAQLNQQYRDKTGSTNVLSFPLPELGIPTDLQPLGDILICPAVALRESQQQLKTLRAHIAHLVIHGVLHLLGHDHQHADETKIMEALERQVLSKFGFADPYLIATE